MVKLLFFFLFITTSISITLAQAQTEENIDGAYQNAKKGIYWALENIPEKKLKLEDDLVADDKLYASVKLEKQINGIKIESIGYYESNSVEIKIYKSNDNLEKEGYLKKMSEN
jgi:hypothetical protein